MSEPIADAYAHRTVMMAGASDPMDNLTPEQERLEADLAEADNYGADDQSA